MRSGGSLHWGAPNGSSPTFTRSGRPCDRTRCRGVQTRRACWSPIHLERIERDAVFAIAVGDRAERRQLTYPRGLVRDSDAAISPDGRHLIFRRDTTPLSGQFFRVSLKTDFTPMASRYP